MYEGPVIYESQVTDYFIIALYIVLAVTIIFFFCFTLGKIFKKADKRFWLAFIPFYNLFPLLEIVHLPSFYFILLIIPIIHLIPIFFISRNLSKVFKKDSKFTVGLFFLPFIYYPILAFSKAKYVGINEEHVEEVVLQDLVKEQVEEVKASTVLRTDQSVTVGTNAVVSSAGQTGILQADNRILEQHKPAPIEYVECPVCKNKVKKGAPVCFICGHKF